MLLVATIVLAGHVLVHDTGSGNADEADSADVNAIVALLDLFNKSQSRGLLSLSNQSDDSFDTMIGKDTHPLDELAKLSPQEARITARHLVVSHPLP